MASVCHRQIFATVPDKERVRISGPQEKGSLVAGIEFREAFY
ncbi:hypothetical protein ACZ87_01050 [Candidatus Erwinia dacicola]|uniref:Uncharacterized protein n=1 Tax=Candidatus Erwinia dacicola TaxID=252393 RepID=A0A328TPH3_9GAMM|nr:hypothetical protein ACZ87_01050 [Candidatus Erwinia dacicola]